MGRGSQITVAVIGAGFAGSAHVEALRRLPGVELVAITTSSTERSAAAAERLGIARSTGRYCELLDDPAIDVIHNCTPNDLHLEVNLAALAAGKHVLAEKPLAMNSAETAKLVEVAATARGITGVCFNYRHYPLIEEARTRIAAGGAPAHLVRGAYLQDWLLEDTDWNWRLDPARSGPTRAMADIGSHWIDLIQHVTGRDIERVCGRLGRLHDVRLRPGSESATFERSAGESMPVKVDSDDFATVLLEFAGGGSGALTVSQVSPGMRNRLVFEVDLPEASYSWNQEQPNELLIGRRDRPDERIVRDPTLMSAPAAAMSHYPAGHPEGWPDALKNLMIDFYTAVRTGTQPVTVATFADAHRVTRVVEAVLESSRGCGWVAV